MREIVYKTFDTETGKLVENPHIPPIFAGSEGSYGFRLDPRYKVLEYVGRRDVKGHRIFTGMILRQSLLNDFDSYTAGAIVEVFYCDDDMGYEVRDPSGKSTEHQAVHPDAEIIALNYKEYISKHDKNEASKMDL